MRIDDQYRLQTEEGAEWEKDYRTRLAAIRDDAVRMNQLRSERLTQAVETALGGLKLTQGASKTPRKLDLYWGQDEPSVDEGDVPVWIRDEWSVTESAVKKSAAEAGDESPVVFVLLPKHESEQIKDDNRQLRRCRGHPAATDTPDRRRKIRAASYEDPPRHRRGTAHRTVPRRRNPCPSVPGRWRRGHDVVFARRRRDRRQPIAHPSLPKVRAAGDNANWGKVVTKARDGAPDALEAVGHHGEPTTNPVCKEILAAITPAARRAATCTSASLRHRTAGREDAVNGAILALLAAGNIRAAQDGKDLAGPKELLPTQIGKVTFYKEDEPPTVTQRLAVQGLLAAADITYEASQEAAQVPALTPATQGSCCPRGGSAATSRTAHHRPPRHTAGARRKPAVPGGR